MHQLYGVETARGLVVPEQLNWCKINWGEPVYMCPKVIIFKQEVFIITKC